MQIPQHTRFGHLTWSLSTASSLVLALLLPSLTHAASHQDQDQRKIIGKWKITTTLDFIDITSRDEKEARELIGHVLIVDKDRAQLDNYKCALSEFETKRVEANLYVKEYAGISAKRLRLPNPVTVIDISCTQVFIKNQNRIVIFWDGWFFEAARIKE
jgi:hypothetical protein